MLQGLITQLKARRSRAVKSAAYGAIALTAAVVALSFFGAAGFMWVSSRHGSVNACLLFGGLFVLIGTIAVFVPAVLTRRVPPQPTKIGLAQALDDPKLLAIGLEIARTVGGRRVGAASLIAAFIVGVLMSRNTSKK